MYTFALTVALLIPHQYDHPFNGKTIILEDADRFCGRSDIYGCAVIGAKDYCIVHLMPGIPKQVRDRVIRHEIAHCNGWDHG